MDPVKQDGQMLTENFVGVSEIAGSFGWLLVLKASAAAGSWWLNGILADEPHGHGHQNQEIIAVTIGVDCAYLAASWSLVVL